MQGQASVAELTGAAYDVASAGFSSAAEATLVLKAASQGATGGFSDINTVANATTSVLNAYGISAENAGKLVDQFIQTQNDGKIVVAEYAQNIGKVASAAASLGVPLSEVNAVIAQSTAAGNQAEVVFTGLKGALARLASGEAEKALKGTGIEISAASVEAEGLFGTLKKLQGLDTGQLFKALGTEAGPALIPVIENLEKYEELIKNQENSAGVAASAAATASGTIEGAWKRVSVAFENLFSDQTEVGQLIRGTLLAAAATVEILGAAFKLVLAPIRLVAELVKAVGAAVFGIKDTEATLQSFTQLWFNIIATVEDVANTIIAVGKVVGDFIGGLIADLAQRFSGLWNGISQGVQGIVGAITGAFSAAFNQAIGLVNRFFNALPGWLKGALQKAGSIVGGVTSAVTGALKSVAKEIQAAKVAVQIDVPDSKDLKLPKFEIPKPTVPTPRPAGRGVGGGGGGGSAGDKLADEAARMAKEMREQIKAGEELQKQQDRRLQLLRAQSDVDKQILQNAFALEDAIEKIKETAAPFQQAGLITDARTEADLKNIALLKKAAEDFGKSAGTELAASLPEATKGLTDLQQLGKDAFDSITGNLKSGIKGLIDGTKDLNDVLQDLISSLADLALNFAFNALSKSLFPGFAEGGRPDPGKISIVGEKGPELFVPDSAGTVIPNDFFEDARDSLQSSLSTSNQDNDFDDARDSLRGSGDGAATANSEAFSAAAAAIARNTTIISNRQSSTNQETSFNNFADSLKSDQREPIRFETVRVGQMDMVTKDEALKIGAESAKAAEASVLSALRNKPKVRRSVGIN